MDINVQAIVNQLNGTDFKVLDWFRYIGDLQAKTGKRGARYACCSQVYVAVKVGKTRETVNHAVGKLVKMGVLRVIHRRKRQGHWMTNVTIVKTWLGRALSKVIDKIRHRVKKPSHIAPPKREGLSPDRVPPLLRDETTAAPEQSKVFLSELASSFQAKLSPFSLKR